MAGRGELIKKVSEALGAGPKIKITEEIRAPFRDFGYKPMARDDGGIDLYDNAGNPFGSYTSVEEALADLNKPKQSSTLTAYHGSPHHFRKFSLSKIGSGEGAQAYGYGLYFAESPGVAKDYRDRLTSAPNMVGDRRLGEVYEEIDRVAASLPAEKAAAEYDKLQALEMLELEGATADEVAEKLSNNPETLAWFNSEIKPNYKPGGALYEVDIRANEEDLIAWDEPISSQPESMQQKLEEAGIYDPALEARHQEINAEIDFLERSIIDINMERLGGDTSRVAESAEKRRKVESLRAEKRSLPQRENPTGRDLYYRAAPQATNPKEASKALEEIGIKGIKYLDAESRGRFGKADKTRNFVIFNPQIIEISKKYGVSIPIAAAMLQQEEARAEGIDANVIDSKDINVDPVPSLSYPTFARDDATGKVLEARQSGNLTPYQQALLKRQAKESAEERKTRLDRPGFGIFGTGVPEGSAEVVGAAVKDIAGGVIETPRQAVAGILDAVSEVSELIDVDPMVAAAIGASVAGLRGAELSFELQKKAREFEVPTIETEARTVTGSLVRGVSQFLTGFLPVFNTMKSAGVSQKIAPYLAGAVADSAVFDPQEARLSNLIQQVPSLENPITEYLSSAPGDSDAEGRFKNAVEGLALGGLTDMFFKSVKLMKARQDITNVARAEGKTAEEVIDDVAQADPEIQKQLVEAEREEQEFIPFEAIAEDTSVSIKVPEFKEGTKQADPERAANINLANLNTTDEVEELIERVAAADAPTINKARRQVITNVELPKLANDLGMTVEDLLARRKGEAFNAEQILAARKILVASGENLMKLSRAAATGGDMELALFRRAMAQHRAIQQQVSGMTAEAGRALQSFKIVAESSRAQERAIKEALDASGGMEVNQKMAQMMAELDDISQLGKFVSEANNVTTFDKLYEVWINGLLSAPATHMVNILSNTMVAALTVGERKLASMMGGNIPPGETTAMLKGMVDGSRDGLRLAWKALKTGEPIDVMEKVEVEKRRAISAESLNLAGTPGRMADLLGDIVRIPGRLLTTGDAFFKTVGYRMELNAQAYRQAFNEGLTGQAAAKRVLQIVNHPPENIKLAAIDAGRYQTFTNELGKFGKSVERLRSSSPYTRIIAPFVRTPINIISFAFERTPLAPLSQSFRDEIAAGGARRDLALGKIAAGSMTMAVAADLALSGSITGAGPVDPNMNKILRTTGWQPYSIKIGDTYYAYNRLDPIGALLGIAADMTEIMGQTTDAEAQELATAAVLSVSQNLASKTYLSGVTDAFDAIFSSSIDPEANNYKLTSWLQRQAASVVPSGVAAIERVMDPSVSATYSVMDRIKSRIPGYSKGLPPRRNIFGEPIVLQGGLGPDIMSPIYTNKEVDDPIANEIVAQQVSISMPRRVINGVELDAQQYDKYVLLYSGQNNKAMKNKPLKVALKELFARPAYKKATDGPEGGKALYIQTVFTAYKDAAKAQMIKEDPTIRSEMVSLERERIEKLTGR